MEYQETEIKSRVMGIDISNDSTTYAIVDIRGNIVADGSFDTSDYQDLNGFVEKLCSAITELAEANGGLLSIRSAGVSVASGSSVTNSIINAPNLPWKGIVPLGAMLRDRLGLAVTVANDAHVAALGEQTFGSAHGLKDFILVTIGEGVGSCFFSAGQEHLGTDGISGEFGHTCVVDEGRLCGCGNRGCLEAYTGAQGIITTARELMAESDEPSLMRSLAELTPHTIKDCCDQGDKMAIEVYSRTGYMLGMALAGYASIINPEAIILTGGVSKAGKWILQPLRQSFAKHIFPSMRSKVRIIISMLNNHERDVLGASVLAWQAKEYSLFV
ncbi:MAG: ROK family protein [Prevotella sp.]|nr:ROK family protein [Prevotella sp.]